MLPSEPVTKAQSWQKPGVRETVQSAFGPEMEETIVNWLLIVGLGACWLGWQIVWAAPVPRQLRSEQPPVPDDPQKAYMLFWRDQYGWIGITLLGLGILAALLGALR